MESGFGATAPYTVGVEEEFQLVDPDTRALTPAVNGVLAAGNGTKLITPELSRSCVEMLSPVFASAADLARELPGLRREVRDLARSQGVEIVAAGAHPFSEPTEQLLTEGVHNLRVEEEMGWLARTQAIYGLHVHVAVPDGDAAIRAVNALAGRVPLLVALSANSPFWRGSDTRLGSTRIKIFEMFPRSGLPPAFRSWEDFENHIEALVASGSIPDYSWCWWDARPHQKFGTVELRSPDVQTDASNTAALVALVQCLIVSSAAAEETPPSNRLFNGENKWRAVRYGLDGKLLDLGKQKEVPVKDLIRELLEFIDDVVDDLGSRKEIEHIHTILDRGTSADEQLKVYYESGERFEPVVDMLIKNTLENVPDVCFD